jgi:hypothetical protein
MGVQRKHQVDVSRCSHDEGTLLVVFLDLSRRNSIELGESSRESEFVVFKERKLVATAPVYQGALRLSFLLETCPPGSVPDAHLLASILDLVTSILQVFQPH